eukprot:COSAG02_NODE_949_length_15704_cov_22.750913_6_plen_58_part_00
MYCSIGQYGESCEDIWEYQTTKISGSEMSGGNDWGTLPVILPVIRSKPIKFSMSTRY